MKILIAVPCMDNVAAGFAQSLAVLQKTGDVAVAFVVGSLIYDSRNKLAQQAVASEADYVMWFDSDMIFKPDTMLKLLEADKDIVSGLYFRRVMPFAPVLFKNLELLEDGNSKWEDYNDFPDELFKLDGIGFGCVLMKTDVLIDMFGKFGTCFDPIGHFGEDLSFCLRAKELGYEIYCDPNVKCGHVGHSIITESFWRGVKNESKS